MTRYFKNNDSSSSKKTFKKRKQVEKSDNHKSKPLKTSKYKSLNEVKKKVDALIAVAKNTSLDRKIQEKLSDTLTRPWERKTEPVPIPQERMAPYSRGEGFSGKGVTSDIHKQKLKKREKNVKFSVEQSARTELLLAEESG